ncbi:MAG: 4Fe-4S dicluster domain-containing protein [Elusimicrobia bacterium]|nr:4Fe-4S dicluster domain-containing protein [Elusimicrobiota bacterium]
MTKTAALAEKIKKITGVQLPECYQCGKCTAGCPMAKYMDLSPNQIMRMLQAGTEASIKDALSSSAIWYCLGCLTCTQRCPKKLDPAAVMDVLREESVSKGIASPVARKILAFHKSFLAVVEQTGRMSEIPLVGLYKLSTLDFFSDLLLGPGMFFRGKLPLKPHLIKGRKEIKRIFSECKSGRRGK